MFEVLPDNLEHVGVEVRVHVFPKNLDGLLLNIFALQELGHSGLAVGH